MITPLELASRFESARIHTYRARCPLCGQHSLRIFSNGEETGFRCINRCDRVRILASVNLTFAALRPPLEGLATGLAPSLADTQTASTQPASAEPLTPVAQDATPGGQQ